jgi:hypothetical protein
MINHNAARLTIEAFVNEWAAPELRDSLREDVTALIVLHGGHVPTLQPAPACEYCARGTLVYDWFGNGKKYHCDLGDIVKCTTS